MLRTVQLLPQKGFRHWASTRTVSNPSRQSATGPPDSYPDRTHTGKRRRARTNRSPRHRAPPVPLGARTIEVSEAFGFAIPLRSNGRKRKCYRIDYLITWLLRVILLSASDRLANNRQARDTLNPPADPAMMRNQNRKCVTM